MTSRDFSNKSSVAGRSVYLRKREIWRKCSAKVCSVCISQKWRDFGNVIKLSRIMWLCSAVILRICVMLLYVDIQGEA
jgi:hypothetical protein